MNTLIVGIDNVTYVDESQSQLLQNAGRLFIPSLLVLIRVQIAPNSTLHFLGPFKTHLSNVKLLRWTILKINQPHAEISGIYKQL